MSEVRCIIFNDNEVLRALVDFLTLNKRQLPRGTFVKVTNNKTVPEEFATLEFRTDDGEQQFLHFSEIELSAALLGFCLGRRVIVPRHASKRIEFIGRDISLILKYDGAGPPAKAQRAAAD
jgi:hypothetical protein